MGTPLLRNLQFSVSIPWIQHDSSQFNTTKDHVSWKLLITDSVLNRIGILAEHALETMLSESIRGLSCLNQYSHANQLGEERFACSWCQSYTAPLTPQSQFGWSEGLLRDLPLWLSTSRCLKAKRVQTLQHLGCKLQRAYWSVPYNRLLSNHAVYYLIVKS